MDNDRVVELLEWLRGKKYIVVDEYSCTMTEEFEQEHNWELSRNIMINRTIAKIFELV